MNVAALIIIDVQKGFNEEYQEYWGNRNNLGAGTNMAYLVAP